MLRSEGGLRRLTCKNLDGDFVKYHGAETQGESREEDDEEVEKQGWGAQARGCMEMGSQPPAIFSQRSSKQGSGLCPKSGIFDDSNVQESMDVKNKQTGEQVGRESKPLAKARRNVVRWRIVLILRTDR